MKPREAILLTLMVCLQVVMVSFSLSGDSVFACKTKPAGAAAKLLFR